MAGFCEVSCVKYCVFTIPLVFTVVQTNGVASSALRRIHAPTRNEKGTYIGASVASDVAIAIALFSQYSKEWWWTDFCWVGGRHARSLFIFASSLVPCLILFGLVALGRPCSALSFFVALPVPSMPSISALLGSRYPHNRKTRFAYLCTFYSLCCIVMQWINRITE